METIVRKLDRCPETITIVPTLLVRTQIGVDVYVFLKRETIHSILSYVCLFFLLCRTQHTRHKKINKKKKGSNFTNLRSSLIHFNLCLINNAFQSVKTFLVILPRWVSGSVTLWFSRENLWTHWFFLRSSDVSDRRRRKN